MSVDAATPPLIPFVIAVTGHRDIRPQDTERLKQEVRRVFVELQRRMPSTPIVLLSGLAQGADQLVAEVALEQKAAIIAVLPMHLEIYKTTMSAEGSANLESLLSLSSNRTTLPLAGHKAEDLLGNEAARTQCYETLAVFLAQHGQALIALWDGKDSTKRGGTSQVVNYVRSGSKDGSPEASRCGVVYQITTPRLSSSEGPRVIETVTLDSERRPSSIYPSTDHEPPAQSTYVQVEAHIERFNQEALKAAASGKNYTPKLIETAEPILTPFQSKLQELYWQADTISLRANGRRRAVLAMILATAIAGTLFYGIHGEMFEPRVALWFTFPAFVLAALLLHRLARAKHVEETYLDSRALAEALRVQFFWELAGIKQPVDRHYLIDGRVDVDWIRLALKNIWLLRKDSEDAVISNTNAVRENWVKEQQGWYRSKARKQAEIVRRREKVSQYALLAAVGWSILVPASILVHGPWHRFGPWNALGPSNWVYQVFHVALAVPALLAAAYRLWIEQAGYDEQSREYRFMELQFAARASELETPGVSSERTQTLILELGIEALNENGRWLLMHRERPLEVLSSP